MNGYISPELFTSVINKVLPEPHASLLGGILFGIPLYTRGELFTQLKAAGLLHIVVLSGFNISLLVAMVSHATLSFGRTISSMISILFIIIFIIFVGPEAPIIRAGIMAILTIVAYVYQRRAFALYNLFLATFLIALFKWDWITSVSYQLSFAATLGIILFGNYGGKKGIIKEIMPSLSAQIFTAPIIFIYFRQIALYAIVANVLVSWIIAPLMIVGFFTSIVGLFTIHVAQNISLFSYGMLSWILFVARIVSSIPYSLIQF